MISAANEWLSNRAPRVGSLPTLIEPCSWKLHRALPKFGEVLTKLSST